MLRFLALSLLLFLFSGAGFASPFTVSAPERLLSPHAPGDGSLGLSADLDGDRKPDRVQGKQGAGGRYFLTLSFSRRDALHIPLKHTTLRHLGVRDLDRDGDLDLMVFGLFYLPVDIWLNDGKGKFRTAPVTLHPADSTVAHHTVRLDDRFAASRSLSLETLWGGNFRTAVRHPVLLFARARDTLPQGLRYSLHPCLASCLTHRGPPLSLSSLRIRPSQG